MDFLTEVLDDAKDMTIARALNALAMVALLVIGVGIVVVQRTRGMDESTYDGWVYYLLTAALVPMFMEGMFRWWAARSQTSDRSQGAPVRRKDEQE